MSKSQRKINDPSTPNQGEAAEDNLSPTDEPPEGQSQNANLGGAVNPSTAAVGSQSQPGLGGTKNDGKRQPKIIIFFRKLLILLWKCSIQRRRSWILLGFEFLFTLFFGSIILLQGPIAGKGKGVTKGSNVTVSSSEQLLKAIPTGEFYYAPDNAQTKKIIEKIKDKLQSEARFTGAKSEAAVEALYNKIAFSAAKKKFVGAIIFEKYTKNELKYKLRFPFIGGENNKYITESMDGSKNEYIDKILPPVRQLFSKEDGMEPRVNRMYRPEFGEDKNGAFNPFYEIRGLLGLQIAADESAAVALTTKPLHGEVQLKVFPYPSVETVKELTGYISSMCLPIIFVFIFTSLFLSKNVIGEKETGVKELMKLSGYPGWMQWLAWYLIVVLVGVVHIILLIFFWFVALSSGGPIIAIKSSDPTVWFFIMLLGVISNAAFVLCLCGVFRSATVGSTVISILLFIILGAGLGGVLTVFFGPDFNAGILMAMSLVPQACLVVGITFLVSFEGLGDGAQWTKIAEELPGFPDLCLGYVILMFMVDTVIYMLLGTYLESVLPSEYGVRKPLYYPFSPIINLIKKREPKSQPINVNPSHATLTTESKATGFEDRKVSTPAGIVVKNIVKRFGPKIAVNNVSMTMYEGEIFALLGHNGAGKTTLISILSGLISPTSGTATINGYDIQDDIEMIRKSLGLCPQHDMIFNNLTVMEHLKIFGAMKGHSLKEVKSQALHLLDMMQLKPKANNYAKDLSGGQKRKLCLAMALSGGASFLILDEPTSGMDPEARRVLWDLLLKIRGERTILLTTHFMEEADVLGDNIAIMAEGQIQCCGSPSFLKSYYGSGYTLKVGLLPGGDKTAILQAVQKHIPNASMKPIKMANELFVTLPAESATSSALMGLFSSLSEKKQEMNIETLGLSMSSMDEVFVKVGELSSGVPHDAETVTPAPDPSSAPDPDPSPKASSHVSQADTEKAVIAKPSNLPPDNITRAKSKRSVVNKMLTQILAVILKKVYYLRRRIWLTLFMLILPVILSIAVSSHISLDIISPEAPSKPLEMKLGSYTRPVTIYYAKQSFQARVKDAIGSDFKPILVKKNMAKELLRYGGQDRSFKRRYIIAGEMDEKGFTAWYNKYALHSPPLAINLASNARAPPKFKITVTIHPLETPESLIIDAAQAWKDNGSAIGKELNLYISFSLLLVLSACFLVQPIAERLNKSKQLQLMTGINPFIYWIITFCFDLFIWTLVATIIIAFMFLCEEYGIFSTYYGLATVFDIVMSYGFFVIPFVYMISRIPKTAAGGIFLLVMLLILPVILATIVMLIAMIAVSPTALKVYFWMYRIFPYLATQLSFEHFGKVAAWNAKCNYFTKAVANVICKASVGNNQKDEYGDLRGCCANCKALGVQCFKPQTAFTWTLPYGEELAKLFGLSSTMPGILQFLVCHVVLAVIILLFHISIEFGLFRVIRALMLKTKESDFEDQVQDDDVQAENQRVIGMVSTKHQDDDAFIVDNLCKSYGSFSAVSRLRFGVHHGECFGLLGTNGAGKTTTFRMITGDEIPSFGNAYEGKITLMSDRVTFLSNIGYCPQFDGFIPSLSGKENLMIFALLRGVPCSQASSEVKTWLEKVGLEKDGNVKAKNYSGGMKRRLSAAVAMIGNPELILLDEPTSGVDPVSRRQFWKILESVKSSGKQSIILTSHSMDECEILCSRLGIMVNGQMQCLGGVQHLKHKFAQGYTLTLKLGTPSTPEEFARAGPALIELSNEIKEKFQPCVLKEQHETLIKYQILNANLGWNVLYSTLEELKNKYGFVIEDYSVSETTLEEVFLSLAQKQYGPRESKTKMWKRILTCQC